MDVSILLIICSAFFAITIIADIIRLVKFVIVSKSEGVLAVKLKVGKFTIPVVIVVIVIIVSSVWGFNKADYLRDRGSFIEEKAISDPEYVEQFISRAEADTGITINDPEVYIRNEVEKYRNQAKSMTYAFVFLLLLAGDGVLTVLKSIVVITNNGCRLSFMKDVIPIFAELDSSTNKIIVKQNDLSGNEVKVFTLKATQKYLSALGKFIKHEDLQEETQ